jgi:hypothetical protein
MNEDQIWNKLEEVQKEYYSSHPKHFFFGKNAQKLECAKQVSEQLEIDALIKRTVFIVLGSNVIFYDYTVFKTFVHDTNYTLVYTHFISLIRGLLETHDTFEIHCNLKSFSISAFHRYYSMIAMTIDENQLFTANMSKLVIYHTPNIMEKMTQLLNNNIRMFVERVEYVSKDNSDSRIASLFTTSSS